MRFFVQCGALLCDCAPPHKGYIWGYDQSPNLSVPPTVPLSDIKVKNLKSGEKPYKVVDCEGLFVLIKVSGAKSWRFKYRIDSKEKLLVIGDYPAVTLAKARQVRDAAKAMLADGVDPHEAKQDEKRLRIEAKGHAFEKVGASFLAKQRIRGGRRF